MHLSGSGTECHCWGIEHPVAGTGVAVAAVTALVVDLARSWKDSTAAVAEQKKPSQTEGAVKPDDEHHGFFC